MDLMATTTGLIALAAVLFVPGYFLTLGFFPAKKDLDVIERITFSFVFSMAFIPIIILLLNQVLSVPVNFFTAAGTVIFLILAGLIVYLVRVQTIKAPKALDKVLPSIKPKDKASIIPKLK